MESTTLMDALERVLDSSHVAVLSTVDETGAPCSRWMVAGMLRGAPGYLYAVTAPGFRKVNQIKKDARVSWLVQSKDFEEILHVSGDAEIVDNPALKSSVLEAIGKHLASFWHQNAAGSEVVVIETNITSIDRVLTESGEHTHASLKK